MSHNTISIFLPKIFFIVIFLVSIARSQSKDWIEFQVKNCSGTVTARIDGSPIYAIKVSVLSGNKEIKDSTYTNLEGNFNLEHVGYVWKPRIKFDSPDYYNKTILLKPKHLNSDNEIVLDISLDPIPDDKKPLTVEKGTIDERAITFFKVGGIYYHLASNEKPYEFKTERIIINNIKTNRTEKNKLILWINSSEVNPLLCYVAQSGRYENLTAILSGYQDNSEFEDSMLPRYLDNNLLEPTLVFGKVIDVTTNEPIAGVQVLINNESKDMRVTGSDGKFAFQIGKTGEIELSVTPPRTKYKIPPSSKLVVTNTKGGWIQTNKFLTPKK